MSSFLTQLNIKAARDAKIPQEVKKGQKTTVRSNDLNPNKEEYRIHRKKRDIGIENARTRKVMQEGNLDGTADDGVNPDPPAGAENGA